MIKVDIVTFAKAWSSLLTICLLTSSCHKSESNFAGNYTSYSVSKIELLNNSVLFGGEYDPNKTNAKAYFDLLPFSINLFVSDNTLKGQASVTVGVANNNELVHHQNLSKIDFEISNIHLNNDTLEFSIENEATRRIGKVFHGKILKNGDEHFVGIENGFFQEFISKNPFYSFSKGGFAFFKSNLESELNKSLIKSFWVSQEKELDSLSKTAKRKVDQNKAENSLKEIRARLLKLG